MSILFLATYFFLLQVYKAWVNCCLGQLGDKRVISDLAEDLKDGVVLSQLIKLTTGHELPCQPVNNLPFDKRMHLSQVSRKA